MDAEKQRAQQTRDRAYLISLGPDAGSAEDNWLRAEAELREEEQAHIVQDAIERGHEVGIRTALTHP